MSKATQPTIFGIRHHGPGSARSLLHALHELRPDIILIEGPSEAEELLALAAHPDMQPPVSLLLYISDQPERAVHYPFALFSPEWQAIRYGMEHGIAVRFMDLPQSHWLASGTVSIPESEVRGEPHEGSEEGSEKLEDVVPDIRVDVDTAVARDPLGWIARAAGFDDSERWWEHMVEQRHTESDIFTAISEMMTALRNEFATTSSEAQEGTLTATDGSVRNIPELREAWMRKTIRQARKEGFERIAVVCGAWHVPALTTMPSAAEDNRLLAGLPKVKVTATWVPWTYGRLAIRSGYGAGVNSPGYYHHLWSSPDDVTVQWMIRVAHLLRGEDLDASTASVIEAVRLAETLSVLRGQPLPGLDELNEASRAIFCFGSDTPMQLIEERLVVADRLGAVPDETPTVPLQQDLTRQQKRLRLKPEADARELDLDLRTENDLARSQLLHRLTLLGINWGTQERAKGKGSFRELWRIQWQPELSVAVIEANVHGNTVEEAATSYAREQAKRTHDLPTLTHLVGRVLTSALPRAIGEVMMHLENAAALTTDIPHLMDALPALAGVMRYGDVRRTDVEMVGHVVQGLVVRICVGLPSACSSLNDEAAAEMLKRIDRVQSAIATLQNRSYVEEWHETMHRLTDSSFHGIVAGRATRILFDAGELESEETARRMNIAISVAAEPGMAAAWLDGFLRGSGQILLHDPRLLPIIDTWLASPGDEAFMQLLPLLRRTFSTFSAPERRQIGEQVKHLRTEGSVKIGANEEEGVDVERANRVLPIVAVLLGLEYHPDTIGSSSIES
jgi:hypothetical protein